MSVEMPTIMQAEQFASVILSNCLATDEEFTSAPMIGELLNVYESGLYERIER